MAVSSSDLWAKAQSLSTSTDEVERREAVRLAYYSIFHDTKAFTRKAGAGVIDCTKEPPRPMGSHALLIWRLKNGDHRDDIRIGVQAFGGDLKPAYENRRVADYELSAQVTDQSAERQIKKVENLRKKLGNLVAAI